MAVAAAASSPFAAAASSPFPAAEDLLSPLSERVQSPEPARLPCWIEAEAVTEDQSFTTAQWGARSAYEKIFKPTYSQLPVTMKSYADIWSLNPDGVDSAEFNTRVKVLIVFQAHRRQAALDLQAISAACDKAIAYCAPFTPDTATLVWLAKLKAPIAQIETNAKTVLSDNLASIVAKKGELAELAEKIETAYTNMKKALDIIARRLESEQYSTISTVAFTVGRAITTRTLGGPTPCLDGFRDRQKLELGIGDPKGNQEIERINQEIVDKLRQELNDLNLNALGSVAPNAASAAAVHDPDDSKEQT
jgi:hypothetical protein